MRKECMTLIRSMTGYGRAEAALDGRTVTVELRAVNNRYLDCSVKMPRSYIFAEDAVKARVQKAVARGKVDVFITIVNNGGEALTVAVNEPLAQSYIAALRRLYELGGGQAVRMDSFAADVARFPDVLIVEKPEEDLDALKEQLLGVLDLALEDFNSMRRKEGERLAEDILEHAGRIEELVAYVEARSPQTVNEYRARLEAKMAEVLGAAQVDEARLLTEAAIFADKIAVDEETVRLHSHLAQLRELLAAGGAVGRKLDFLVQEFNREANTIGSKCSDIDITRRVVDLKSEIEKIREQIQNLE